MTTNDLLLIGLGLKRRPPPPDRQNPSIDLRTRISRSELDALERLVASTIGGPFSVEKFRREMKGAGCPIALMTAYAHLRKAPFVACREDGKWEYVG